MGNFSPIARMICISKGDYPNRKYKKASARLTFL